MVKEINIKAKNHTPRPEEFRLIDDCVFKVVANHLKGPFIEAILKPILGEDISVENIQIQKPNDKTPAVYTPIFDCLVTLKGYKKTEREKRRNDGSCLTKRHIQIFHNKQVTRDIVKVFIYPNDFFLPTISICFCENDCYGYGKPINTIGYCCKQLGNELVEEMGKLILFNYKAESFDSETQSALANDLTSAEEAQIKGDIFRKALSLARGKLLTEVMDMLKEREREFVEAGIEIGRQEGLEKGRKEGLEKGREEGIGIGAERKEREFIVFLFKHKATLDFIAESASKSVDEIKAILREEGEEV